jgi:hypothetical protein
MLGAGDRSWLRTMNISERKQAQPVLEDRHDTSGQIPAGDAIDEGDESIEKSSGSSKSSESSGLYARATIMRL